MNIKNRKTGFMASLQYTTAVAVQIANMSLGHHVQIRKFTAFNQRHMIHVHLSAVQSLILFLKRDNGVSCLTLSSRLCHRKLPRKDSESSPKATLISPSKVH